MSPSPSLLEISSVTRRFPGQSTAALEDVSFSVRKGECLVISGANGSGKSVLMHIIAGLDAPTKGTIEHPATGGNKLRIGLVFQDADAQILGDTPLEDAAWGPRNKGASRAEAETRARTALHLAGLAGKEVHPARTLSGGEKRRLAVAGILAMEAELIIFDEPFANLDWPGVVQVNAIISDLLRNGTTLIILTHELEKVLGLANRLIILYQGRLVFDGLPQTALSGTSLEQWGIRNPLRSYTSVTDLVWTADQ